ncbi:cupin domain-containing protein [Pseudonocardia kujensis]|uniref:cupin domain-containing protein n=1 Tax=Pseudonocardia kujensis TaxID=1128675 RepID=UPI001E56B14C|nr:cupin domain-containing protein [Pseudonocardia kujensis]MCE0764595.1 cupin domain-containing protein [Pseudonocardia kujensis]
MTTEPELTKHRVLRGGDGTNLGAIGLGIYTRLTGADTKGAYSLFEYVVPPGLGGPPTHIHSREDELFTCVQNKVTVELDGEKHVLGEGDSLLMPRGVPHVFYNPFDEETRIVAVVSPPGLEVYYKELSELPPGRDMKLVGEVMSRHGLSLAGPPPGP